MVYKLYLNKAIIFFFKKKGGEREGRKEEGSLYRETKLGPCSFVPQGKLSVSLRAT